MKNVWFSIICLLVGLLVGFALCTREPTVHECMSVCLEEIPEFYDDTVDYD